MERITPLSEKQLNSLPRTMNRTNKPFRVLANGCAVNIATGICEKKHTNIMYHPVYWDRPKEFVEMVLKYLQKNNPDIKFRITYH